MDVYYADIRVFFVATSRAAWQHGELHGTCDFLLLEVAIAPCEFIVDFLQFAPPFSPALHLPVELIGVIINRDVLPLSFLRELESLTKSSLLTTLRIQGQ